MPIEQFRINPIDLLPDVSVGVALPFNGDAVFVPTYSTKDQIRYNLINLMLTNKGERIMNPRFGSDVRKMIFEFVTNENIEDLKSLILDSIAEFIKEITVQSIEATSEPDFHSITLKIDYFITLSGTKDEIVISLEN